MGDESAEIDWGTAAHVLEAVDAEPDGATARFPRMSSSQGDRSVRLVHDRLDQLDVTWMTLLIIEPSDARRFFTR